MVKSLRPVAVRLNPIMSLVSLVTPVYCSVLYCSMFSMPHFFTSPTPRIRNLFFSFVHDTDNPSSESLKLPRFTRSSSTSTLIFGHSIFPLSPLSAYLPELLLSALVVAEGSHDLHVGAIRLDGVKQKLALLSLGRYSAGDRHDILLENDATDKTIESGQRPQRRKGGGAWGKWPRKRRVIRNDFKMLYSTEHGPPMTYPPITKALLVKVKHG